MNNIPSGIGDHQFNNPFSQPSQPQSNEIISFQQQSSFLDNNIIEESNNQQPFNTFNNKNTNTIFNNNSNNTRPPMKYAMLDMFWLINEKLFNNEKLLNGESQICVIGFNASFGNLRVEFRSIKSDSFHGTAIVHTNCPKITSFNIYSEEAYKILYNRNINTEFFIIERLINVSNWIPNESYVKWNNPQQISFKTIDKTSNQTHWITLSVIQTEMVIKALEYMINGNAWNSILNQKNNNIIV